MGYWDRDEIRTEIRKLTGRLSVTNPSNAQLNKRINRFVRYKLPAEIHMLEQEAFYSFDTVASTGSYSFPDDFHTLTAPAYVGDDEMDVWLDSEAFWRMYAIDTSETASKPYDILLENDNIILRPVPDDAYTIRIWGHKRPAILDDDGDELENDNWGEVVAYGVAIDFLIASGDFERAAQIRPYYEIIKENIHSKTEQTFDMARSVPMF